MGGFCGWTWLKRECGSSVAGMGGFWSENAAVPLEEYGSAVVESSCR